MGKERRTYAYRIDDHGRDHRYPITPELEAQMAMYDIHGNLRADMAGQLRTADAVLRFITGGNAYCTIRSRKTQTRFTYRFRVAQAALDAHQNPVPYFISLLSGSDNEGDYQFFGTMFVDMETKAVKEYRHGKNTKTHITEDATSVHAVKWMLKQLHKGGTALENPSNFLHQLEVWHDGRCGRCGRKLTVPESIASGFGPECVQFV